jgi:pimeloyl-ACP methyl ester carboxylesterase
MTRLILMFLFCLSGAAMAQDRLIKVPTRQSESITYWWMPTQGASATVLLFSGGSGGMGYRDGQPQSRNFLVRSRDLFRAEGLNVAVIGNPSDKSALDPGWRGSDKHFIDVANIIKDIQSKATPQPVWLIGTSMGTISAAANAIALQDQISGVVLTASMTNFQVPNAVPRLELEQIKVPVLVYHHKNDACRYTPAHETSWITRKLNPATTKKLVLVEGGANPTGDPCEALHWHGFIGMEQQAVQDIARWIKNPD